MLIGAWCLQSNGASVIPPSNFLLFLLFPRSLWDSPPHRAAMVRDQYDKEFLRFIMLLINDTLDQLDEARNAVTEMIELADKARTTALTDEETKTMEQKKATAEYATTSTSLSAPFPYLSLSSMPRCTCYVVRSAWCPCVSGADWC